MPAGGRVNWGLIYLFFIVIVYCDGINKEPESGAHP